MRMIVAAAMMAALVTPSFAQNAKITEAAAVLAGIQKDKAKLKSYCEMQELFNKSAEAAEKKNTDEANTINKQAEEKAKGLGADFQKVMALEEEINPESAEGKQFFDALEAIEKDCKK